jgi:hypothetical protein
MALLQMVQFNPACRLRATSQKRERYDDRPFQGNGLASADNFAL